MKLYVCVSEKCELNMTTAFIWGVVMCDMVASHHSLHLHGTG